MTYRTCGRERGVIVELTPFGARGLFSRPLKSIATSSVCFGDLLGARARMLTERLWEAPSWPERFRVLDFWLSEWMFDSPSLPRQVQGALTEIGRRSGRVAVGDLAEHAGWTRQHLCARFREEIGLSPKTIGRIARFHRAIQLIARPDPPRWSDVAVACGYADQAHLNLDFRALAGRTPTELTNPGEADIWMSVRANTALQAARQELGPGAASS
jgi:AraC-like DNA-binding protein